MNLVGVIIWASVWIVITKLTWNYLNQGKEINSGYVEVVVSPGQKIQINSTLPVTIEAADDTFFALHNPTTGQVISGKKTDNPLG